MHFQIYTMYVNRKDLLEIALSSLGNYQEQAVVLDNSPQQDLVLDRFRGEIFTPSVPLYCNQSYNLIQKLAEQRRQDVFFIMHSDAKVSHHVVTAMLERAEQLNEQQRRWGVMFTSSGSNKDVICLHNTPLLSGMHWDPFLPLYYTDIDFYYRLKLAGLELIESYLPVDHMGSGSNTQSDPAIKRYVEANYPAWRHYYMMKWGGDNGEERFTSAFGPPTEEA